MQDSMQKMPFYEKIVRAIASILIPFEAPKHFNSINESIKSDWKSVGDDLRISINQIKKDKLNVKN